jgi:hypothetical protein
VKLEVLKAASMKMDVFWVVAPCGVAEVYLRFGGAYSHHQQGDKPEGSHLHIPVMFHNL